MEHGSSFSARYGFEPSDVEIGIWHDAPEDLRAAVVSIAYEVSLGPKALRDLVCRVLRKRPNPNNWSEYPNIDDEVRSLVDWCEWYEVYDIIEAVHSELFRMGAYNQGMSRAQSFAAEVNRTFRKKGIGWQLSNGKLLIRGADSFERELREAQQQLDDSGRATAANELREATQDLSRRPFPDITGAVQHALAALECLARDVSGDSKSTLGALIKQRPDLVPPPLDRAISAIWGFASEKGRHIREGHAPEMPEAELLVALAASTISYLSRSH